MTASGLIFHRYSYQWVPTLSSFHFFCVFSFNPPSVSWVGSVYFKILPVAAIQPHCDTKLSKKSSIIESGKSMFYFIQCANSPEVCISKQLFYIICPTYISSFVNLGEGGDTERVLSGKIIFFVRKNGWSGQALHKLRRSLLKRPERDKVLCKRSTL